MVIKRDGREVPFDVERIKKAVFKAAISSGYNSKKSSDIALIISDKIGSCDGMAVEQIQDVVERLLMENANGVAKNYILYRKQRTDVREGKTSLMDTLHELTYQDAVDSDVKRENANVDADAPMGTMLKYGSEAAKQFYLLHMLKPEHAKAHTDGYIHIHDLDFYALTTTCTQISLKKLFAEGFATGHGFLREPNSIGTAAALTCIAIQANQNDQHGGQSIPNFDFDLAKYVSKTMKSTFLEYASLNNDIQDGAVKRVADWFDGRIASGASVMNADAAMKICAVIFGKQTDEDFNVHNIVDIFAKALEKTEKLTYQAMESLIHNLNTMHSRAGAQVPFSSINYGMDTSPEGRMIVKNVLLAEEAGLGHGETPIFPIHVFKVKDGVNGNPEDPNHDLFKLACRVSAKRLFPNFEFLDAPYNLAFYEEGDPESHVSTMGCRTRVMANNYDKTRETTSGRGNLSFTTINLPRLAIEAHGDIEAFMKAYDEKISLVFDQLLERFEVQARRHVYNYPFLMGQGVWMDSEKLLPDDEVREVLKHGTLTIGFIGLAECLKVLIGKHHGESEEAQALGLRIIRHMRERADAASKQMKMNFSVIATPAEGLSGRFVRMDKQRFGEISGVTDRDYYTNSMHVPVYFPISAFKKIEIEAPYHELCNGGHITYVEVDGDPAQNVEAFEQIIQHMKQAGIGYGSINHPVDRDPLCGYTGIIGDVCPRCGRHDGEGVDIEVLRKLGVPVNDWRSADDKAETDDKLPNITF